MERKYKSTGRRRQRNGRQGRKTEGVEEEKEKEE